MNEIIKEKLKKLPKSSGVYIMRNIDGQVIYVGKAKILKNRVSQYFNNGAKQQKVKNMVEKVYDFDYFITLSERDAFALENNLIKKYQPFYNILLKDGKQYPYIKVNLKEKYPKFEVTRKLLKDGAKYFGPYISGISPYELLKVINYAFPIRNCSHKLDAKPLKSECLNYHLGICSAPCTRRVDETKYREYVNEAIDFLNGNDKNIEKVLTEKMTRLSDEENFELALEVRDMIKMVKRLKEKVVANLPKSLEIDAFSYQTDGISAALSQIVIRGGKILGIQTFSAIDASMEESEVLSSYLYQYYEKHTPPAEILVGSQIQDKEELESLLAEKKGKKVEIKQPQKSVKLDIIKMCRNNALEHIERNTLTDKRKYDKTFGALEKLKQALNLKELPLRMECFDISNLSGTNVVSSMTVFTNGAPDRKQYRKFKIKSVEGQDDFACMHETLLRRLERLSKGDVSFNKKPNLIVIDGGKGQLSSAVEALKKCGYEDIEIISLAERLEEIFIPNQSNSIRLKYGSAELNLLQNIRDEAHRFAITFHRQTRNKKMLLSPLDEIKGIGKVKKQALLSQFTTSEEIAKASVEELNLVKGIDISLAQKIYDHFHSDKK